MALSRLQRLGYRLMGHRLQKSATSNVHLRISLLKAHVRLRPEVYLAYAYLNMFLSFAVVILLTGGAIVLAATHVVPIPPVVLLLLVPLPIVVAFSIYLLTFVLPDLRAAQRAKDIDAKLPYALNYISTMATAGVTPERIFASLGDQAIYGEVCVEAQLITRDLRLLGRDLVTALTAAIDRSPSIHLQDFLQGAITALTSGDSLKNYFLAKSEQFVYDNRQEQKRFLDNLGVLAESYVTVVVAAPLFVIVLLSVLMLFGGRGADSLNIGYILILLLLPIAQLGFAFTMKQMTPEA